jgi:hypothetical protein
VRRIESVHSGTNLVVEFGRRAKESSILGFRRMCEFRGVQISDHSAAEDKDDQWLRIGRGH